MLWNLRRGRKMFVVFIVSTFHDILVILSGIFHCLNYKIIRYGMSLSAQSVE